MINPFKGLTIIKIIKIQKVSYISKNCTPLKYLFSIGKFNVYLCAYHPKKIKYKKRAVSWMKKFINVQEEKIGLEDGNESIQMINCTSKQDSSYIGTIEGTFKFLKRGIVEFYSTRGGRVACTGRTKNGTWWGWSHRAMYHFSVGDKIKYDDSLVILSHGWIEGSPKYESEEMRIKAVEEMFKDGILEIEDESQARFLAERFAESVA